MCGSDSVCDLKGALAGIRQVAANNSLSVRVVHSNTHSKRGRALQHDRHARELRTAIEEHGFDGPDGLKAARFHHREFKRIVPSGLLSIGRRTLPIETAEESSG